MGLQDEVDQWVETRNELQKEINELQNQETELQNILNLHQLTNCKLKLANNVASTTTKLIKNNIVTSLEREVVSDIGGGLGRLAAVAAARARPRPPARLRCRRPAALHTPSTSRNLKYAAAKGAQRTRAARGEGAR